MALPPFEQFEQAITGASSVLVVCRPNPSVDEIVASLAIAARVRQTGKQADVVSEGFSQPRALKFLNEPTEIKPQVGQLQDFIISVQLPGGGLEKIHHEIIDGAVVISVTPQTGTITPSNIGMRTSQFRYDLIIVIGAQDLSSLGTTYTANTPLFNAVPVVNIDHSPANEQFGHINLVDITLTSVSEMVYTIFTATRGDVIQPIANLLLTGMIAATQSFKTRNVNARTLQTASALIALGADRELIVHNLYRQRSIATLKLWGAVLSRLQTDPQLPLMWSTLTREDFARAGAAEKDLDDLIDELIYTAPNAKVFALVYERPDKPEDVRVLIDAQKPYRADALASGFSNTEGVSGRTLSQLEHYTLADATTRVMNVLRAKMRI